MLYVWLRDQINFDCYIFLLKLSTGASVLLNSLGLSPCWSSKEVIGQRLIICSKLIADLLFVYEFVFFGSCSFSSTSILGEHVSFGTNACSIFLE